MSVSETKFFIYSVLWSLLIFSLASTIRWSVNASLVIWSTAYLYFIVKSVMNQRRMLALPGANVFIQSSLTIVTVCLVTLPELVRLKIL